MAIKIKMSEEVEQRLREIRKRERYAAVITSAVLVLLMLAMLWVTKILIADKDNASFLVYQPETEEIQDTPKVQDISGGSPPAAPPIEGSVSQDVDTSAVLPLEFSVSVSADFSDPLGTSLSGGNGLGKGMGGGGGSGMGSSKKAESAFCGRFWDLKKTYNGADSRYVDNSANIDVLKLESQFFNSGWNMGIFSPYFEAKTRLYSSCFFMPNCMDQEATHAYDPKGKMKMKASRWVALYRAKVKAPKTGRFRFLGAGDSVLAVRFDGKNVLSCGFHKIQTGEWNGYHVDREEGKDGGGAKLVAYEGCDFWNAQFGGFRAGETFSVEKDQWYEMQVLVSEIGGGNFGFCLLIDDMDEEGKKMTKDGKPLFQLFRTTFISPDINEVYEGIRFKDDELRVNPPYDPDSMIWEARPIESGSSQSR